MCKTKVNIVLFGIGNVGSTLIKQVFESRAFIIEKQEIDLKFVVIANSRVAIFNKNGIKNNWANDFETNAITYDIEDVVKYVREHNLENLIFIDATASITITEKYQLLIQNGFNIVAANKKANTLSMAFYSELRNNLKQFNQNFNYETNVGGGLPVIKTIKDLYTSGEKITKIRGVFSGSLSYLFNRFSAEDVAFSTVLIDAEKLGLTEPDSRDDLSGQDVARKLLILARELDLNLELHDIAVESLLLPNLNETNSKAEYSINKAFFDKPFQIAKITQKEAHVLRYLGELDLESQKSEVKLVSVSTATALGQLQGADNLIEIYTLSYGDIPIVIQGAGAGKEVTARGVLTDVLEMGKKIKVLEKAYQLV